MAKLLRFLRFPKKYEKHLDPLLWKVNIVFPKLNIYENYTKCLYFYLKKTSNSIVESTLGVVYLTCLQKNHVAGWELFFVFFVWIYEHTHFSFSQYIVYRTNENIDIIMYEGIDTSVLVSLYDFYIFFFALFMKFLFCLFSKNNFTLEFQRLKSSQYTHAHLWFPLLFLAVNHHNAKNWVPSILTHNFD